MRLAKGKLTTTDGPFTESKEMIGGWAILKADSKAEILRLTTELLELHRKYWPEFEGECEVRPIDFWRATRVARSSSPIPDDQTKGREPCE